MSVGSCVRFKTSQTKPMPHCLKLAHWGSPRKRRVAFLQARKKVDLVGKSIFHFGSHRKGGGCDFLLPVANVKFHSELKVLIDGNVVVGYCHNKVGLGRCCLHA